MNGLINNFVWTFEQGFCHLVLCLESFHLKCSFNLYRFLWFRRSASTIFYWAKFNNWIKIIVLIRIFWSVKVCQCNDFYKLLRGGELVATYVTNNNSTYRPLFYVAYLYWSLFPIRFSFSNLFLGYRYLIPKNPIEHSDKNTIPLWLEENH